MTVFRRIAAAARRRPHVSALERLFAEADLCLVDVGARGAPRPELRRLAGYSRLIAFEPEVAEAERLKDALRDELPWREVMLVPQAIAGRCAEMTLHLTHHPGMSSLLPVDEAVAARYWKADAFRSAGSQTVSGTTLDDAAHRFGFRGACFLKLDTQGTELEILRSGAALVRDALIGIDVETLFQPFYSRQSLFPDVDVHLRECGFLLVGMRPWFMRASGYDAALFSQRQPVWAHCLYLRDQARLNGVRDHARHLAIALAYEHFDLALVAARRRPLAGVYGEALAYDVEAEARLATERRLAGAASESRVELLAASGPA